jgi:hypothetical protein
MKYGTQEKTYQYEAQYIRDAFLLENPAEIVSPKDEDPGQYDDDGYAHGCKI